MKTFPLKCAAALFISAFIFSACKKSGTSFQSTGVIYKTQGILTTCNNCWAGLYYIKFSSDTTKHYIDNNVSQLGITPDVKLPANVSVNWQPDNTAGNNYVTITALRVNN